MWTRSQQASLHEAGIELSVCEVPSQADLTSSDMEGWMRTYLYGEEQGQSNGAKIRSCKGQPWSGDKVFGVSCWAH